MWAHLNPKKWMTEKKRNWILLLKAGTGELLINSERI